MPHVASLHLHPVKSCAGLSVASLDLDARGAVGDRRFMVVDADGRFVTQRDLPRMAAIAAGLERGGVRLSAPGLPEISASPRARRLPVSVWGYSGVAVDCGDAVADWLKAFLGAPCRLVHFPDEARRAVDSRHAPEGGEVAFADAFPLLVVSQGALDVLGAKLDAPVDARRFRPNIVLAGCEPHAEDSWKRVRIGTVAVDIVKPCERCTIPNVDPVTGRRGKEPLRTLSRYRRDSDGKVTFGQNAVHRSHGTISVGAPVDVLL